MNKVAEFINTSSVNTIQELNTVVRHFTNITDPKIFSKLAYLAGEKNHPNQIKNIRLDYCQVVNMMGRPCITCTVEYEFYDDVACKWIIAVSTIGWDGKKYLIEHKYTRG